MVFQSYRDRERDRRRRDGRDDARHKDGDDGVEKHRVGATAATRVSWYSKDFFDYAEKLVISELKRSQDEPLGSSDAVGLSAIVRSLDTFQRGLDADSIEYLRERIGRHFDTYWPREQILIAHQLVPVLTRCGLTISSKMTDCIDGINEIGGIPATETVTLEGEVGEGLKALGVTYRSSVFKAGFELDFLIDMHGGAGVHPR